jgi:plasmid stabilization system protein ParE
MKSNFELNISEEAELDIDEIFIWYEEQQENLGFKFINDLKLQLIEIVNRPLSFRIFQEIEYENIRIALLNKFPYLVYFSIENKNVTILLVISASRNPDYILKRII